MLDPICDMTVDAAKAAGEFAFEGETYFFCSLHCQKLFQADPAKYLAAAAARQSSTPAAHQQHTQELESQRARESAIYTCPMDPEVRQQGAGACPKCGMALEPLDIGAALTQTENICPMHPEVVSDSPGSCPKCGMALEARTVTLTEEKNPELEDMTRRFWLGTALSLPVLSVAMADMLPGQPLHGLASPRGLTWLQLLLSTPVVLWCGWPFFQRAWASARNRSPNMFTLVGMGVGTAYGYSMVATLEPSWFPASFRGHGGEVGVYFEAAAVITTFGFARPGARAARAQQNQWRDSRAARSRA